MVDLDSHAVLWNTFAHERRPTASLGKVFTVMVAMDHISDLGRLVTVPPGGEDDDPTHSVVGLHVGDRLSYRDLISGIWLALQLGGYSRLGAWTQDRARTVKQRDFFRIGLSQYLRAQGPQIPRGLLRPVRYGSAQWS